MDATTRIVITCGDTSDECTIAELLADNAGDPVVADAVNDVIENGFAEFGGGAAPLVVLTLAGTWSARVMTAETLDELCAVLNEFEDTRGDDDTHEDHGVDCAGLPTYGGPAPADTNGVWSWDETRALYVAEDGSWYVDERTDLD